MNERGVYLLQLAGTLAILAFVPGNLYKLSAFLVLWAVIFRRLGGQETVLVLFACVFFSAMNVATLSQGAFRFNAPDFLGMPAYEFVMWGFYLLHTRRILGRPAAPVRPQLATVVLALLYCIAFAAIPAAWLLLLVTAVLLAAGLAVHHERHDLLYVGYMIVLGALIEFTGVWSGNWSYPGGGVPLWFVTLWGGVGYFLHRLILPAIALAVPSPVRSAEE